MKLKFKNQDFQTDAVNAVVDLFTGQEKTRSTFSVVEEKQMSLMNDLGVGNALFIDGQAISDNMHTVQKRNRLPMTPNAEDMQFCIEMETGTGKTYVYTKTIFELNRKYGFTKFIIVVPSVAIREGVYKSFEITKEHFGLQYDNVPCRYFIYNSAKLSDVRQFATSANIEIMIINIDAFKKAENIINQAQDKLNGETAMRFIQDTHPIVIIDEPQSVDNTAKAKEAIASLNPLCVLRYSATHREKINLLYRLTPVDAYQMGLVKQIAVSSNQVSGGFNQPYVKLLSVSNDKGFRAKLELDAKGKNGVVARKTVTVKPGDDLFLLSGERELYEGYSIAGIDCTPGYEHVEFGNTEEVALGKAIGDVDENIVKRAQIRRTIEAHLDKELRYADKGIKVLSLFFIDKVEKYRHEDGTPGIYAKMFEECYLELLAKPKYEPIRERFTADVSKVHNGYFSQDKKGRLKDTKGDTQADDDTYNTIMRDKEWLLSFECPLRFIFSHSALKEGWDNPNVFQVCTLIDQKSTFTCRQKVGRGLRLCVNQDGERIEDKNINVLHVMANESFADFADTLQKEIEDETGVKFGVLQLDLFAGMVYEEQVEHEHTIDEAEAHELVKYWTENGTLDKWMSDPEMQAAEKKISEQLEKGEIQSPPNPATEVMRQIKMGATPEQAATAIVGITSRVTETVEKEISYEDAQELMQHFEQKGYITSTGKMKDTMKNALKTGTLDLPKKYEAARERFEAIIANADRKPPIRDASRDVVVRINKQVMLSPEFMELWNKIKQKTAYRVSIDTDKLVENCVKDFRDMPVIPKTRLISQTADVHIEKAGIYHTEREMRTMDVADSYSMLPDLITAISDETLLTPATVNRILIESGRCKDFLNNPEAFLEKAMEIIRNNRHALAIDGISYVKLDGKEYYVQEIFDTTELIANLDRNAVKVEHSVYDYIVYDSSSIERPFAVALDNDPDVKMFFKIPERFKIETPIGTYNPDWAVLLTKNGEEKLYFVLETKGSTSFMDLRTREQLKIHCGRKHFEALNNGIEMQVATNWSEIKARV
ncbi:MAG: DEAD/DEAH box helicase family protein [Eubacteriales bacterium]|nr:DEAD/DEAH box helicase family protein [Eubacteriales bacterium]